MNEVVDRAARSAGGWAPSAPSGLRIQEIESFAAAAKRAGQADPCDVDGHLQEGTRAFLARDYAAAIRIFHALLIPMGDDDIDLGQDELVDEVLGVDVDTCAKQYVVAMYVTASPKNRAPALSSAIDDMRGVVHLFEPLRELERVAIEPLPGLEGFLVHWRALVEERVARAAESAWDRREDIGAGIHVAQPELGSEGLVVLDIDA